MSTDPTKPSAEMVAKAREYPPCTLYTGWECNGDRVCTKHYDMALALDAIAAERDEARRAITAEEYALSDEHAFHFLWTWAVGLPGYAKARWTDVYNRIVRLQRDFATERAARSQLESSYVVLADAELFVRLERDDLLRDLRIEHEGGKALSDELDRERAALADSRAMCAAKDEALRKVNALVRGWRVASRTAEVPAGPSFKAMADILDDTLALTPDSVHAQREVERKVIEAVEVVRTTFLRRLDEGVDQVAAFLSIKNELAAVFVASRALRVEPA